MADLPEKDLQGTPVYLNWLFPDARELFALFSTGEDEKIEARYIGDLVRALGLVPTEAQIARYGFKDKPSMFFSFVSSGNSNDLSIRKSRYFLLLILKCMVYFLPT